MPRQRPRSAAFQRRRQIRTPVDVLRQRQPSTTAAARAARPTAKATAGGLLEPGAMLRLRQANAVIQNLMRRRLALRPLLCLLIAMNTRRRRSRSSAKPCANWEPAVRSSRRRRLVDNAIASAGAKPTVLPNGQPTARTRGALCVSCHAPRRSHVLPSCGDFEALSQRSQRALPRHSKRSAMEVLQQPCTRIVARGCQTPPSRSLSSRPKLAPEAAASTMQSLQRGRRQRSSPTGNSRLALAVHSACPLALPDAPTCFHPWGRSRRSPSAPRELPQGIPGGRPWTCCRSHARAS